MKNRDISIVILFLLLCAFIKGNCALTMAYVPLIDSDFYGMYYNNAKIRQACIEVHGEKWFKDNIILDRKYRGGSIFISNTNFMAISCIKADPMDFMDLKTVIDYMASQNDTLYIVVSNEEFARMSTSLEALNDHMFHSTSLKFRDSVFDPILNHILAGEKPDINNPDLIIVSYGHFILGNEGVVDEDLRAYEKICKKEVYMNLNTWFDKEKVTERDIDLYYDFTVTSDKRLLETKPTRIIPINVHYEANPNEEEIYIKYKNRTPEATPR